MGRSPPCNPKDSLNKGAWAASEDKILRDYIKIHGEGKWSNVAKKTGLKRCGKSCRLRWMNYLRPDIKRGNISSDEEELIIRLHKLLGNRWSLIAGRLPGRTDNEIKNYWNTNLAKRSSDLSASKTQPTTTPTRVQNQSGLDPEPYIRNSLASNNNYSMEPKNMIRTYNETHDHQSSDGTLSSSSVENHNSSSSDLMMVFDVDDFCKIFDSDYRIDVNYDQPTNNLVEVGDDEGIIHNVMSCETEEELAQTFPEKVMKENWSTGSEGIQENNQESDMDTQFPTLASSFFESADDQEWPGYDLNIITHAGKLINQI